MTNWPRNVGVYGRLVNLQVRLITGIMGRSDFPLSNRSKFLSQSVNFALYAWMSNFWTDFQNNLIALLTEQYKWSFLLAASENYSGPMIFDSNTINFIKKLNNKIESSFERELITKFSISKLNLGANLLKKTELTQTLFGTKLRLMVTAVSLRIL